MGPNWKQAGGGAGNLRLEPEGKVKYENKQPQWLEGHHSASRRLEAQGDILMLQGNKTILEEECQVKAVQLENEG